ncbi:Uncharacterised protein [Yersinia enterocolitica]|nr:Uncharacterised protein [Yersinia enterocolitica]
MGKISPPPSLIVTRHCPQEPPPPHAEETNMPWLESILSSLSPAGAVKLLSVSSFISIVISPVFTSFDLANKIITVNAKTMRVNITTPRIISMNYSCLYKFTPEKDINPKAISPVVIKVIPNPCKPAGTLAYFIFSRIPANATMANIQPIPEPNP